MCFIRTHQPILLDQNTGLRLKEGAAINRSLLALGNCINALAEKKTKCSTNITNITSIKSINNINNIILSKSPIDVSHTLDKK